TASASDAGTPSAAAIEPTSDELTIWAVGCAPPPLDVGVDVDTISVVAGAALELEPPTLWRLVPEISRPAGSRPLAAASESTLTPMRAAIALRVSPRCTT